MKTINIPVKLKNKKFTGDFGLIKSEIDNGNTITSFSFESDTIVFSFDKHTTKPPKLTITESKPVKDKIVSPIGQRAYSDGLEATGTIYKVIVKDEVVEMFKELFSIKDNGLKPGISLETLADEIFYKGCKEFFKWYENMIKEKISEHKDIEELQKQLGDKTKIVKIEASSKEDAIRQIKEMLEALDEDKPDEKSNL